MIESDSLDHELQGVEQAAQKSLGFPLGVDIIPSENCKTQSFLVAVSLEYAIVIRQPVKIWRLNAHVLQEERSRKLARQGVSQSCLVCDCTTDFFVN